MDSFLIDWTLFSVFTPVMGYLLRAFGRLIGGRWNEE